MSIRNILVHVDNSASSEHRIEAAIKLANQHQASIKTVHIVPDYIVPTYFEAQISPDIIDEASRKAMAKAQESKLIYDRMLSSFSDKTEGLIEEGNLTSKLAGHARFCDLVILGQNHPDDPDNMSEALAVNIVLESGTPCLVIPFLGIKETLGQRILVAWNATRESARAIKDAMPILVQAEKVDVLIINPDHCDIDDKDSHSRSLCAYLSQHGVNAEIKIDTATQGRPGDVILDQAHNIDADLIVMGAYGHSRLRE